MNPLVAHINRQVGARRLTRVVELGAVGGLACIGHLARIASLTVVEPDQEAIAKATSELLPDTPRFQVKKSELHQLASIPIDSVDACVSVFGVASSPDIERLLRQVKRVLDPSGVFVFAAAHPLIGVRALDRLPSDHSYFETSIVDTSVLGLGFETPPRLVVRSIGKLISEVRKAGFALDALEEVSADDASGAGLVPDFVIIRCSKA